MFTYRTTLPWSFLPWSVCPTFHRWHLRFHLSAVDPPAIPGTHLHFQYLLRSQRPFKMFNAKMKLDFVFWKKKPILLLLKVGRTCVQKYTTKEKVEVIKNTWDLTWKWQRDKIDHNILSWNFYKYMLNPTRELPLQILLNIHGLMILPYILWRQWTWNIWKK